MPEGPSIIIVKETLSPFRGKVVSAASGSAKIDFDRITNQKIIGLKSWGKHFLIVFKDFTIRIHLLMFGTYRVNEGKQLKPRLTLQFTNGEVINFYTCAVKWIEGDLSMAYDWTADVMGDSWNAAVTRKKLKLNNAMMVCDALMDQDIFSGVGNIIKNEVLFRVRVHPEALIKNLPEPKISAVIKEARVYSFEFLEWKKADVLKKHWLIYTKKICPRCKVPVIKKETGQSRRRSFFCVNCQLLYKKRS